VVEKNKVLKGGPHTEELFDWPTATRHANGRDWWLVMPSDTGSVYHVFLATPEGVEDRGSQYLPYPYPTPINRRDKGQNVFTLMGDRYVDFDMWGLNIRVYDFDRCTGELDNIRWLDISANISQDSVLPNSGNDRTLFGGGAAISPSGRFLYIDQGRTVYQLDLEAEDFRGSIEIVAEYDGYQSPYGSYFYLMQLGPDGRIYINSTNGENVMHVIDRPNEKGLACDVRQHSLHLPRYNYRSMPHYPNYRLSPLDGSPCDTLGLDNHPLAGFRYEVDTLDPLQVEFIDNSFYEPTDWLWDFGGTGSSTEVNPVYTFPSPGTYIVCLTVSNQYDSGTFCREVEVEVTGVEEKKDENFAAIYPNPASGEIHLYLRLPGSREAVLSLYVVTGRKVREWKVPTPKGASGQHGHTFPVAGLAEGMYFWKVEAEGGRVQSGKLIISR
ncbi:MAG TPA: T9SS type A sorting domain-containing protein, partial [Bacteroidetes bacterium]|nr:T9SS type A sorting domain-containing protein [Bacteroidota bacterium]